MILLMLQETRMVVVADVPSGAHQVRTLALGGLCDCHGPTHLAVRGLMFPEASVLTPRIRGK